MKKKDLNEEIIFLNCFFLFGDLIHAYPRFDLVNSFLA